MPISPDDLAKLQSLVATFVADKATADEATSSRNAAQTVLTQAQGTLALAMTKEAQADGVVNTDLATLQSFIATLTPEVPPTPLAQGRH